MADDGSAQSTTVWPLPKFFFQVKWGDQEMSFQEVSGLEHVGDARAWGLMGGVEIVKDKKTNEGYPWEEKTGWQVVYKARERGLFLRPLGNVIVIMPPLVISEDNLKQMLDVIAESIQEITAQ